MVMVAATAQAETHRDVLALSVDGKDAGDVLALVDGDLIALDRDVLCAHGICLAGDWIPLSQLADRLGYTFDATSGALAIETIVDTRPISVIDLQPGMPAGIERAETSSLFVNYAVTAEYEQPTIGFAEGGLSIAGRALAYSTVVASEDDVVRGMSYLSTELRDHLVRIDAGDNVVSGGVLGGGGLIGGLHVHRDFGMDPYYVARPTLSHSGVVTTPSVVEVYRDGVLVTRAPIAPGPYRVEDLVGASSSDAKIVVRDAFGSATSTMIAPAPTALRPGLSQFDYSIGWVRRELATRSFDYREPALLAVHRYGLTNRVTLGARVEGTPDRASGGASLLASVGPFVVDATVGGSSGPDIAAALQLGWRHRALTVNALGRIAGARYATLDLAAEEDRALASGTLAASWSATSSTTMTAQFSGEHRRDTPDRTNASAGALIQLSPMLTLSLTASAAKTRDLPLEVDALAMLSVAVGAHTNGSLSTSARGTTEATLARSTPRTRGIGMQAQASAGERTSASSRVTAVHEHGRLELSCDWTPGARVAAATVSGGIAVVGDTLVATRAVQSGFALVRTAAPGTRVYVDNQLVGRTNDRGVLVVPDLQANYANRVRVDVRDLPMTMSLAKVERLVAPPTLGSVVVDFATAARAFVHGRFVGPVDTSFGNVRFGETVAPIGTGGVFELENVPAGRHAILVEVAGRRCTATLVVPANTRDFDAGDLACVP
jgi:outer membrane usher protein